MTRLMLVDALVSVRQMMSVLLPQVGAYEVVGDTGCGLEAIRLHQTNKPHVIVFDLCLPGLSGIGLLKHLREHAPATRTLVLTGTSNRELTVEALRLHPHGFVLKRDSWKEFLEALRMVSAGYSYFTPLATQALDEGGRERTGPLLTPRELSVVQMVAEGRRNKEISAELGVSIKTIEHHRAHVMTKLGVRDVAGLTRYAVRKGLVVLE